MIIVRTPVRISFLGGGTDYPAYFRKYGGATLATTIDKYTYVTVRRLAAGFEHRIGVHYARVEQVQTFDEIEHPAVRESLRLLDIQQGVEIHLASDLPVCTGLGSSSSFTVGLLKALHAYKGDSVSAQQVAREAVYVEQVMIQERVGCQDQYVCAYGGMLHLQFERDSEIRVIPLALGRARLAALQQYLMLFDTGIRRMAHMILKEQLMRTETSAIDYELAGLRALVDPGLHILTKSACLAEFGSLLHEGWMLKRRLSPQVSNPHIDELYDRARMAGATGGKLLGAGGGGFLLIFAEPGIQLRIRQALSELCEVKFSFDNTGSEILLSPGASDV